MEGLIGLAVLALLAVPVLLVIALTMIAGLRGRVGRLEGDMLALRQWQAEAWQREPTLAERTGALVPGLPGEVRAGAQPGAAGGADPR